MAAFLQKIPTRADWIVPFLIAALTAIGSLYMANRHDTVEAQSQQTVQMQTLDSRVTTLEQRQKDQDQHISHIEQQVDRLVLWALGSK